MAGLEVQNLVFHFKRNYFELHNIDFLKIAHFIGDDLIFPPTYSGISEYSLALKNMVSNIVVDLGFFHPHQKHMKDA